MASSNPAPTRVGCPAKSSGPRPGPSPIRPGPRSLITPPRRVGPALHAAAPAAPGPTTTAPGDSAPSASNYVLKNGLVDYYELLGVDDAAPQDEIKLAFRSLAKECHPDVNPDGHNLCILLNEAYACLTNPTTRKVYNTDLQEALKDEDDDYTGQPLSKWTPQSNPAMARNEDPTESRAVFVDETVCIGCTYCAGICPATFAMEESFGRSRVGAQWVDAEEDLQTAIDSCPVNCIHWVERRDLAALEYVTQRKLGRVDVGIMGGSNSPLMGDPFEASAQFLKDRARKAAAVAARARQYSSAQQEAYRAAAETLRSQQQGWFGATLNAMADRLATQVRGTPVDARGVDDAAADGAEVGSRRRSMSWQARARQHMWKASEVMQTYTGDDGSTVPHNRSLVLSSSDEED